MKRFIISNIRHLREMAVSGSYTSLSTNDLMADRSQIQFM